LLLFVGEETGIEGRLRIRPLDAAGNPVGPPQPVEPPHAQQVMAATPYPAGFLNPGKPWQPLIAAAAGAWAGLVSALDFAGVLVRVDVDLPAAATQVEIGLVADIRSRGPSWGVLVFDGLIEAEILRERFDQEERTRQIAVVDGALGPDQAKRAL